MTEKQHPFDAPPDARAVCYQCGHVTGQRYSHEYQTMHCENCQAEQCERVRCRGCGRTCTRPEGAHYCSGSRYTPDNPEGR